MHSVLKNILILIFIARLGFSFAQERRSDYLSGEFHKDRREKLREALPENSVAVFFANPVRNRANDVDYIYHQDPDFYYLTGYTEPHAVLLVFKSNQTNPSGESYNEIIFVQEKNKLMEMWTGVRLGPTGAKERLGLNNAFNNSEFAEYNIDFSSFDKVLFFDFKGDVRDTGSQSDLYDLIQQFKVKVNYPSASSTTIEVEPEKNNLDVSSLAGIMDGLRGVKTAEELELLRKAVSISAIGQAEVMKAMRPGISETEIQGIHEFVFKKYGAEYEGYPSIVGAGHNGCILHYIDNHKPAVDSKEMVLMDLGAEYHGYTADVTRTVPVNGKFSPEQKAIYDLVYEAQQSAMDAIKEGTTWQEISTIARDIINKGLVDLGIIESADAQHLYYPHGLGHHIGLDVHDRGSYSQPLQENMVITVEPGIYIPRDSNCDPKWWEIAVRIEDDVLITKEGYELLSYQAPRKSEEIEALMKESSILERFELPSLDK